MAKDSPVFLTRVECPICKTVNEFETVKVGAYLEKGRDTDFCPTEIEWRNPEYQLHNPLAFFVATCSNCFYSREFNSAYKEWKDDANFKTYRLKTIKQKHLEQLAAADSFVKRLGEHTDIASRPNESAIMKLLLAAFDEGLADHHSQLDLGRFYLRIAWVFRSMESGSDPGQKVVRGLMGEIEDRYAALRTAAGRLNDEAQYFARHLASQFESEQLSPDVRAAMLPFRERFDAAVKDLAEPQQQLEERLTALSNLMVEYREAVLGRDGSTPTLAFGSHPSFVDFLLELRKGWDGIVVNEREAMQKAAGHYQAAFESGRELAKGNQQIQAAYLIAELSRRVGDHESAKQFFNKTIKLGQEYIYQSRHDRSRTALARKILELAVEQGRLNLAALKQT